MKSPRRKVNPPGTNQYKAKKKGQTGINLKAIGIPVIALLLFFTGIIFYRIYKSQESLVPISVLAIIAGIVYESKRISQSWTRILYMGIGAFAISFFAFLPGKLEKDYSFDMHIQQWPYVFMIAFMIISLFFHEDKIRPKLNEGITLLQSLAIIYWVIDANIFETKNIFIIILLVFGVLYSLYALVHAFSDISLNRGNRFKLSLWSSFVMLFLAVDNIIKVYNNGDIESYSDGMQAIYVGLQYFLLGVSGIYIVENILMLIRFLPDKHNFFNKVYFKDLRILQKEYVERFSEEQVLIKDSIYATLFTIFCFGLNFYFQWLPRNMMIWLVFVTIPYLFFWYQNYLKKR